MRGAVRFRAPEVCWLRAVVDTWAKAKAVGGGGGGVSNTGVVGTELAAVGVSGTDVATGIASRRAVAMFRQ